MNTAMSVSEINNSRDEDSFSIIERLADAIRIEDDVRITPEDRARLVQDLYEGPRKCMCCVNWIDEIPPDVDLDTIEKDEDSHPLIVRRNVMPGEGKTQVVVHSVEVRNPAAREVLSRVFDGLDNIVPEVKYLIFLAPFRQFFWRWDRFEKAVEEEKNEVVKTILLQLRVIVKKELAEAFAVSNELIKHGIITYKHLWTIFPPGELVYSCDDDEDRFYLLQSERMHRESKKSYELSCRYVDWNGTNFGYGTETLDIWEFKGTSKITDLKVYPAKFLEDQDEIRAACLKRGQKFFECAGVKYKAYRSLSHHSEHEKDNDIGVGPKTKSQLNRRIILDARGGLRDTTPLVAADKLPFFTGLIRQAPISTAPPGGHVPLVQDPMLLRQGHPGRMPPHMNGPRPYPGAPPAGPWHANGLPRTRPGPVGKSYRKGAGMAPPPRQPIPGVWRRRDSVSSVGSDTESDDDDDKETLTDFQLLLCTNLMHGFCLKEKRWRQFDVNRVCDIEWNSVPFESLVLPTGYKELILSFVESQLMEGDSFDDVINGKGGGLVILLAGDPGVGKTLTAESVAEKLQVPLYKMELGSTRSAEDDDGVTVDVKGGSDEDDIVTAFELAAKWKAVLLIDECDMYLEQRSDSSPKRNRLVSRFLQELEYYPSLLFLTTNREKVLDPAIYSRIHLTINYPELDAPSRRTIWHTFLSREPDSRVSEQELDTLACVVINGRRIRNITKTAKIMAKREGRGIRFTDIKQVMRITEGLHI